MGRPGNVSLLYHAMQVKVVLCFGHGTSSITGPTDLHRWKLHAVPVRADTKAAKDECPSAVCEMKRRTDGHAW